MLGSFSKSLYFIKLADLSYLFYLLVSLQLNESEVEGSSSNLHYTKDLNNCIYCCSELHCIYRVKGMPNPNYSRILIIAKV